MSKLDEAKDFPLIQVLDHATPPEKKSKPKRSVIVLPATLGHFSWLCYWHSCAKVCRAAKQQPEQAERMQALRNACKWRA